MLARIPRVLLLATAWLAGFEFRAPAQSESPADFSGADPAAILLAPVLPGVGRTPLRSGERPSSLERPASEPAARLAPVGESAIVRVSDFESARHADKSDAERRRAPVTDDAFEYLTSGRVTRNSDGKPTRTGLREDDEPRVRRSEQLGDKIDDIIGGRRGGIFDRDRGLFKSDCAFDNFVSPVTNPFLFEDPRSLTELRTTFIYQRIPGNSGLFRGGSAWAIAAQGRLAITERLSLVVNKLGFSGFNPGTDSPLNDSFGFSEIWLGPKFVVYREPDTKTLLSLGATFQLPVGRSSAFQDTGTLSIVPYLSAARRLAETRFGALNGMASSGYSFSTNRARSDYFYLSGHVDFDVANRGKFFPLVEMNWIRYTTDGNARNLGVEGRDLANFGSQRGGTGLLTIAAGARYKPGDRWEFGGAIEFPLVGSKDIFQYRLTFDFIWRY